MTHQAGPKTSPGELTDLLQRWRAGEEEAATALLERIYPQLRALASLRLAGHDISLQVTELVHELYLHLAGSKQPDWRDRRHFIGVAAHKMRQLVVDHARRRNRLKRGGPAVDQPLREEIVGAPQERREPLDVMALDRALSTLEGLHPEAARIVELRFFAGFEVRELATLLQTSPTSVKRRWRFAKAWLRREMEEGAAV